MGELEKIWRTRMERYQAFAMENSARGEYAKAAEHQAQADALICVLDDIRRGDAGEEA